MMSNETNQADRPPPSRSTRTAEAFPELSVLECQTVLLLYHRHGVEAVPLVLDAGIVVGRQVPADVTIPDQCLSRRHARFTLVAPEQVVVEDQGSRNGTFVARERVERATVRPGDDIRLGTIVASLIVTSGAEASAHALEGHDAFQRAAEIEIARTRFPRRFAMMVVRTAAPGDGSLPAWYPRLRRLLRPVDRVALYGTDTVEILLPDVTPEAARELGRAITARCQDEPPLVCGIALFAGAAGSAEILVDISREAARRATLAEPVILEGEAHRTVAGGGAALRPDEPGIVAESPAMRAALVTIARLADSTIPVLFHGETGTGKEVFANLLHASGPRRQKPLLCVNCGAIAENLLESTLFGHEKGAFTGADRQHRGLFEAADGGTIFLDEIGELTKAAQTSLLRVLETRRFPRLGATRELEVDVRVIAATHRDLEAMCAAGAFREDLYFRLNTMVLSLPPLRARREDIRPLAFLFLERAAKANRRIIRSIAKDALARLESYAFPGNIRELRNVIERAVVLADSYEITLNDLPERVRDASLSASAAENTAAPRYTGPYRERIEHFEADTILETLKECRGNLTEAARQLKLPIRTLHHKIKVLGIKKEFGQG